MSEESTNPSLTTRLLHDYQQNFPICPAPFAELAGRLGVAENVLLRVLEQLRREGRISRVGAVFAPKRIGASTLAVMAVPPDNTPIKRRPRPLASAEGIHRPEPEEPPSVVPWS